MTLHLSYTSYQFNNKIASICCDVHHLNCHATHMCCLLPLASPNAQLEIEQNFLGTKPHTAEFSSLSTIFSHWRPLQAPSHSQRHRITTIIIQFYLLFLLLLFDFVHKSSFARRRYTIPASPATSSKKHSILMHKTTSRFLFGVASAAASGWRVCMKESARGNG